MAEYDKTDLGMPYNTGRHSDRLLQDRRRAEKVPSHAKWIGNKLQEPRRVGDQQRKVMADVVDESYGYQRIAELQRQLTQRPVTGCDEFHDPDKKKIDREVDEGREQQHQPLPVVVQPDEEEVWLGDGPGQNGIDVLPEHLHPSQRFVYTIECRRREHKQHAKQNARMVCGLFDQSDEWPTQAHHRIRPARQPRCVGDWRDLAEEAEEDGEELAVAEPCFGTKDCGRRKVQQAVAEQGQTQRARRRMPEELEPDEAHIERESRVIAEPRRILKP